MYPRWYASLLLSLSDNVTLWLLSALFLGFFDDQIFNFRFFLTTHAVCLHWLNAVRSRQGVLETNMESWHVRLCLFLLCCSYWPDLRTLPMLCHAGITQRELHRRFCCGGPRVRQQQLILPMWPLFSLSNTIFLIVLEENFSDLFQDRDFCRVVRSDGYEDKRTVAILPCNDEWFCGGILFYRSVRCVSCAVRTASQTQRGWWLVVWLLLSLVLAGLLLLLMADGLTDWLTTRYWSDPPGRSHCHPYPCWQSEGGQQEEPMELP